MVIKTGNEALIKQIAESRNNLMVQKEKKDDSSPGGFLNPFYSSYRKDGDKRPLEIQYCKLCAALGADPAFGEVTAFNCLWQSPEIWNKELSKWLIDFKLSPKTGYHETLEELIDCGYLEPCVKDREELHTIWRGDRALLKKITALLKQRGERYTQEPPVPNERSDE